MRKRKEDWLVVGIATLGQSETSGLTIERMVLELGVTADAFRPNCTKYNHINFDGSG